MNTVNAPPPGVSRSFTPIWTGFEMIVWGAAETSGSPGLGGRYNPFTDNWTRTSTVNAPLARGYHTTIWTGNEMVVWGGDSGAAKQNTGGRYNPQTDSWT